jgi:hypothetical protein
MKLEINELNRKRKFSQISEQQNMQTLHARITELNRKNDTLSDLCAENLQSESPPVKRQKLY